MLFANYDFIDGALSRDGELYTSFLFLLVIGLVVIVLPSIYLLYLFVKFKKADGVKFLNKLWFSCLLISQVLSLITIVLGWIFFYGESLLGTGADAGQLGFNLVLSFVILSFVLTAGWYLVLLMFSQYIWISINDNGLSTITAEIKKEKVETIIKDETLGKVYINYLESKKSLKKIAYSISSTMGQFVLQEAEKLGVKLKIDDQQELFKQRTVELKAVNLEKISNLKDKMESKKEEESTSIDKDETVK